MQQAADTAWVLSVHNAYLRCSDQDEPQRTVSFVQSDSSWMVLDVFVENHNTMPELPDRAGRPTSPLASQLHRKSFLHLRCATAKLTAGLVPFELLTWLQAFRGEPPMQVMFSGRATKSKPSSMHTVRLYPFNSGCVPSEHARHQQSNHLVTLWNQLFLRCPDPAVNLYQATEIYMPPDVITLETTIPESYRY